MIGRKTTKSMIARLEALEKRSPNSLAVFLQIEGEQRKLTLSEYLALPAEQRNRVDLSRFHITGSNLKEFDTLLDAMLGNDAAI